MKIAVSGVVESIYTDVRPGDIIDVKDDRAAIWISQKLCEAVDPNTSITTARLKTPAHY